MAVTVYSKPRCSQCEDTKRLLKKKGIEYEEINLAQNPDALDYVKNTLGFTQAPVVDAGNAVWSGFKPERIEKLDED